MRRKAAEKKAQSPDLVDRIFELLGDHMPDLDAAQVAEAKAAIRHEVGGMNAGYIRSGYDARRAELGQKILALFNGRNAREVARELDCSRATVYRFLKQPGLRDKLSQVPARLETPGEVASPQPNLPLAASAAETD